MRVNALSTFPGSGDIAQLQASNVEVQYAIPAFRGGDDGQDGVGKELIQADLNQLVAYRSRALAFAFAASTSRSRAGADV
jgi:hypothetical protein